MYLLLLSKMANFFCCIFCFFLREDPEEQSACLVEAYRLVRSTAYQLHLVIQHNLVVQDLVTFFSSCGVSVQRGQVKVVLTREYVKH